MKLWEPHPLSQNAGSRASGSAPARYNAGTVSRMAGLKNSVGTPVEELGIKAENHVILMASGHLESARELKQLKGSFLTKAICEGITNKLQEADADKDGALSLQDLRKWLENRAVLHNRNHPDQRVPIPQQFGRGRGDFYLTVRVTWQPFEIMWPDGSTMIALPKSGRMVGWPASARLLF
jgi:hypothetical protein